MIHSMIFTGELIRSELFSFPDFFPSDFLFVRSSMQLERPLIPSLLGGWSQVSKHGDCKSPRLGIVVPLPNGLL